ncbi:type IV pilus assembly protein PilA [Planomicrobium stackebrandtii]|uniref:Type IV pilus assembly protein PilA n=1 Tax=Planomicrobium stackebrandtii TaxID=253160 RepID=A0ABU0GXA0_9BACL|nr:prepilin-type N-terminal cleavage/methylation domain-containing protein [Planomicrobium stackebrandtii]MDQ0429928.1 type IV pilus assembly protein PilA [Planomicrobium stackebrandtii]
MKKYLQKKLNNEKGMTLIELLAVIVIIAIIAAIAIPAIGTIIENSRHGAVKSDYQNALSAANIFFTENPSEADVTVDELVNGITTGATGAEVTSSSYMDDAGSLADGVLITAVQGGNTIEGAAAANGNTYDITTAINNSGLSALSNAQFGDDYQTN